MDKIRNKISKLESANDIDQLYSFLINLVKYSDNPHQYEQEFNKYLDSSDWRLKKAAVFCLLFALQIDNSDYRQRALKFIGDIKEDEEVRVWACSGLAQTYQNTKDKELLRFLINRLDNENEDDYLRSSIISGALLIYGLTSREQFLRSDEVTPESETILNTFKKELDEIRTLIK